MKQETADKIMKWVGARTGSSHYSGKKSRFVRNPRFYLHDFEEFINSLVGEDIEKPDKPYQKVYTRPEPKTSPPTSRMWINSSDPRIKKYIKDNNPEYRTID